MTEAARPAPSPWPNRRERRAHEARARKRVDASASAELLREIDAYIASAIGNRTLQFFPGDTVERLMQREAPLAFAAAERAGFALSFDLPDMTKQALGRGIVNYSLTRRPLN